ncbi:MAG TPA: ATP-binding protein [Polyangiaceae bacterium]|jgi:signal transduction histidine kinase|nr:ATP-binding protein [Polyangiaceae bacterium]
MSDVSPGRRRTVAARVLLSYALVTLAFSVVVGWSVVAMRNAAREAVLMRSGYLPLALALRDAVASQDVWNTQLNHVTTAKNPADQRDWFDIALRGGRPQTFRTLRAAMHQAFGSDEARVRGKGADLSREATRIEDFLEGDRELVPRLFEALNSRNEERAESLREQLVTRGSEAKRRLSELERTVQHLVDSLISEARQRERLAMELLASLAAFTLIVGVLMALYARRVLAPLGAVTERARAVAAGDLAPHPVVASDDEIGVLAVTFENMVAAIARANAELLAAERLATIGKMAAHVTHEIRNPLSSLALNVELLEEELSDGLEARTLLRAVKTEVDRLTSLSERYLSVARRRPISVEKEDIAQVCRDALDFMKADLSRHGIKLELDVDDDLPSVSVDEGQIRQALYNLVRNAREAMPSGGRIVLSTRPLGDGVVITVDDEGGGIDEETRERLFEPFFTTKGHGTGLGLVITREIVEAHGGKIRCEPRPGGGTRFAIELPGPLPDQKG